MSMAMALLTAKPGGGGGGGGREGDICVLCVLCVRKETSVCVCGRERVHACAYACAPETGTPALAHVMPTKALSDCRQRPMAREKAVGGSRREARTLMPGPTSSESTDTMGNHIKNRRASDRVPAVLAEENMADRAHPSATSAWPKQKSSENRMPNAVNWKTGRRTRAMRRAATAKSNW